MMVVPCPMRTPFFIITLPATIVAAAFRFSTSITVTSPSAPAEMIDNFAKQILDNKEQSQKIYEKLYEMKVVEDIKGKIKVGEKAVSADEFAKLAKEM